MNTICITGRIGKDCEIRHTANGKAVCSFSVAFDTGWGDNKKTTWARCAIFGRRAESGLTQYLKKGAAVAVSGEVSMNEWERDGVKHQTLEIAVGSIDLIGGRPEPTQHEKAKADGYQPETGFDDDLPF